MDHATSNPSAIDRPSGKVILVDDCDRVLLFRANEQLPNGTQRVIWFPPGGGAEGDEGFAETAARELREETGLEVAPEELGPPVATRLGMWDFRGVRYRVEEVFFFLRVPVWEVSTAQFTELEQELVTGHRWWSVDELAATEETVFPPRLAELVQRLVAGEVLVELVVLEWVDTAV